MCSDPHLSHVPHTTNAHPDCGGPSEHIYYPHGFPDYHLTQHLVMCQAIFSLGLLLSSVSHCSEGESQVNLAGLCGSCLWTSARAHHFGLALFPPSQITPSQDDLITLLCCLLAPVYPHNKPTS